LNDCRVNGRRGHSGDRVHSAGRTSRTVNAASSQAIALSMFSSRPPPTRSTIALPRFIHGRRPCDSVGVVRPHCQRILIADNGLVDVCPAVPGDAIFPGVADVHCRHRPRDGAGSRVRTASDTSAHPRVAKCIANRQHCRVCGHLSRRRRRDPPLLHGTPGRRAGPAQATRGVRYSVCPTLHLT
jgi:hypothetical protein